MNRITLAINERGYYTRVCSDEPLEFYVVSPHTPEDWVYLYTTVEVGPQFVQEEIGGHRVGHLADGTIDVGIPVSPKLPPSVPYCDR
jgi:hypothetical protein